MKLPINFTYSICSSQSIEFRLFTVTNVPATAYNLHQLSNVNPPAVKNLSEFIQIFSES
jgi:hypothetical protein